MPENTNPAQSNPPPQSGGGSGGSGLAPNVASLLCYVCTIITGIIFLVIEKENKEVKFHAWQAIFLGGAAIALSIVLNILGAIFASIAGFLGLIITVIAFVVNLGIFIIWIVAMIKAYKGEHWLIPVIGNLAEQQVNKAA
ncbi:MAG: DUF4870 domain-containing protein [bacterium]|nr:DUF4870 domain-containing protein [bacterium]